MTDSEKSDTDMSQVSPVEYMQQNLVNSVLAENQCKRAHPRVYLHYLEKEIQDYLVIMKKYFSVIKSVPLKSGTLSSTV